jgi:3-oxoadipate enol-lactonase
VIERTEGHLRVSDGEDIWFETAGDGAPLVLSHGLGGNAAVWYQQIPYFAQRYRVITWDQRGFGRSTNMTSRPGPVSAASDLLALLDHLDVERAALVGQSMGGWATLGAALRAPERVAAVVLACTTAGIPPAEMPAMDPGLVRASVGAMPLGVHPAVGERLLELDPARAYLYQALGSFGRRPSDPEFARLLHETTFDPDDLAAFDRPVLMVCGEFDGLMTPERVRDAATRFPNASVVEMAGRGHSPYFEDPDLWNAVVGDFLQSAYTTSLPGVAG